MKSASPIENLQTVGRSSDRFLGIGHVLASKAAPVVVASCFAIISSVATTSADTVVLYGNVADPFPQIAVSTDLYPTNVSVATMSAQQFVTGELGTVSSISLPVAVSGYLTGVLHVEIWDDSSGKPGAKVASVGDIDMLLWTGANFEYQLVTFDRPVTGLEPNTKHYVVFDQTDINVSGFEQTYFTGGSADSEGTNNAVKFQALVNGNWRYASDFRGPSNNYQAMEILEISPPPLNIDLEIATATALSWDSKADSTYVIESSTDMEDWAVAVEAIEGTGERLTHFFTRSDTVVFYRVEETP